MFVFPDDWNHAKSTAKKKRKLEASEQDQGFASLENSNTITSCATVNDIVKSIHNTKSTPAIPLDFDLDVILTHVSFCEILGNLFHEASNTQIPVVTKLYEESYMREPYQDERACVSGSMCECNFIDPSMPFTGVEFLPPGEPPSSTAQFCVLCSRKITQKLFYDILFTGKEHKGCIQRYGNLCNIPKEYARDCVLICPSHMPMHYMPFPMMSHQRNKYEVYVSNGIRTLRQLRVGYEDFCTPLTKE